MKYFFFMCVVFASSFSYGQSDEVSGQNVKSGIKNVDLVKSTSPIEEKVQSNTEKLVKTLKLNEKQGKSLKSVLMEFETSLDKIEKSKLTNQDKFKKLTLLNKSRQNKLKTIFTEEQYKAYMLSFP